MTGTRKWVITALALAMMAAACGGSGGATSAPSQSSAPGESTAPGTAEAPSSSTGVKIKVVDAGEAHGVAMQKLAPIFKEKTGIDVEVEILPYDATYETETLTLSTGQSDIDVVVFDVIWTEQFNQNNWLLDLKPLSDDPNLPDLDLAGYVPGVIDAYHSRNGGVFGVPIDFTAQLLAYRKDLFEEAGIAGPPKTWAEFAEYAKKLTKDTNGDGKVDQYGYVFHAGGADAAYSDWLVRMAGRELPAGQKEFLLNADLSAAAFDDNPYGVDALQELMDVRAYAPPGSVGFDYGESIQTFQEGSAAMYIDWQVTFGGFENAEESAVAGKVGYAPAPYATSPHVYAGGWQMGINAKSEHPKEAYQFLAWIGSDEGQKAMLEAGSPTAYRMVAFNDQAILDANPVVAATKAAFEQGTTVGFPQVATFVELQQEMFTQIQAALTDKSSAQDAIRKAAEGVDSVLSGQ